MHGSTSHKPLFLELDPLPDPVRSRLPEHVEVVPLDKAPQVRESIEILASRGKTTIDGPFLDQHPKLGLIAVYGVGYDKVDAAAASKRGVLVTHTPDVLNQDVADLAVALLLATIRQVPQADAFVRRGAWADGPYALTATLRGRKIGLVGMGRIGREIAARISAFNVGVAYHSRRPAEGVPYRYFARLPGLAEAVDTLVVIVPGGAQTRNLIDAAILEALGPNGVLVNVARGSVVDQPALVEALRKGTIMAAGLDVFENEPHVPKELTAMNNVVLLPHLGSSTVHTRAAMDRLYIDNVFAWAQRLPVPTPVPECRRLT